MWRTRAAASDRRRSSLPNASGPPASSVSTLVKVQPPHAVVARRLAGEAAELGLPRQRQPLGRVRRAGGHGQGELLGPGRASPPIHARTRPSPSRGIVPLFTPNPSRRWKLV